MPIRAGADKRKTATRPGESLDRNLVRLYTCTMKKKTALVYTNVGFFPGQHKFLKHLAIEERKGLADLVRDAVDALIEKKRSRGAWSEKEDFVLHKLGRAWLAKEERPYRPEKWSEVDRDLYGRDPHR